MSARGARSRKVVAKEIEKKEKKLAQKQKAPDTVRRPHDAFAEWNPTSSLGGRDTIGIPSRSITVSSDASRATSRSSSTHASGRPRLNTINSIDSSDLSVPRRPKTSASGTTSLSDISSKGKDKTKYQAKGKETKAPRGRGGGVPIKRSTVNSPPTPSFRTESSASYAPHHQLQSPTSNKSWINFRVWEGGESGLQPYGGFEYDEHMKTGNVLIYFKEEQISEDRPVPQIHAHLDVLENSGSTWLSNALLYGRIDDNEDEWTLPGSPDTSFPANVGYALGQRRMLSPTSPGGRSPPPFNIDRDQASYYGVPGSAAPPSRNFNYHDMDSPSSSHQSPNYGAPQRATHELWFTAPAHCKTPQAQRLHHVAVRNFLAMLHNKPIVGADLYEMLSTLQPEIQVMYDLDDDQQSRSPRERSVQMIKDYLCEHKLDDIRNSIKRSLGILAWAEQDSVRWREAYVESFIHLAGVMSPQLEELPDFKKLSIITRRNVGFAAKTLQLRVMEAEEKLASFDFSDLWEDPAKASQTPVFQSYNAFRQFLVDYYTKIYGNWPPSRSKSWLNRRMVLALQEDFGTLYDYLVNRDIVWDSQEERPGKKWEMASRKADDFKADFPGFSLTDMLVTFDNKHAFLHIPHPYPLLPREVPSVKAPVKKSFFGLKKVKQDVTKDAKAHLQLSIVFSDATNIEKTDVSFNGSTLIDQFERFELSSDLKGVSPREARLGRWVLIYGILQVLSKLSVDVQTLKWTEGVRYFLCAEVRRCPDWVTNGQAEYIEATQRRSWCWQRPWGINPMSNVPIELEATTTTSSFPMPPPTQPLPRAPGDRDTMDGATLLQSDIYRISEKIDEMGRSRRDERRLMNEKIKQEEFSMTKRVDESYRLTESDFSRGMSMNGHGGDGMAGMAPLVPNRSPLRSPSQPGQRAPRGYFPPAREMVDDGRGGWA
ncbi:hypothetical protein P154DRAFT_558605 [Amniculicola lignicola CBS 123094]|uniref:DUF8004 domain-containing protein n=1 Tax=Amniculicola lignicola CBS 123094 TaxID=1392246 RepID=A0A6A5X339_9PLEO|nr:hypothetical protein P154DRAFT_558605 [Amniculicola lignicola CBS 123094]